MQREAEKIDMTDYAIFRQRLDKVLRTLDVNQLQKFLIAEGQWSPGSPSDPTFAMWMMIAASPTLSDLHAQAQNWLRTHGHEEEAQGLLGKQKRAGGATKRAPSRGPQGQRAGQGQNARSQSAMKRRTPRDH